MAHDKRLHMAFGAVASFIAGLVTLFFSNPLAPWAGIASAIFIGVAKEIWDIKHGTPEFLDFLATAIGGALVSILFFVF